MLASQNALRTTALLAPLIIAGALTGCATTAPGGDTEQATQARHAAAEIARHLYRGPTDTIDDYARWADDDLAGRDSPQLIGYTTYPDATHNDPFGALQLRVTVERYDGADPYVACFESQFDYWGVVTDNHAGWDDDNAVTHPIECPADAQPLTPPVDTRPIYVVPDGTDDVVVDVLTLATAHDSAADVLADVNKRMPQPTGDREVAFEPSVTIGDQQIGFAMGDADECLLAVRRASGDVEVLNIPRVLLQPGELGCRAETALRPVDQLRAPH
ncbi:hypothetical protein ET475_05730 [Microbacterium protaetiae]|uniref:Lipoprotein n=1 Tax=Microbacterium protaetiae TaxID=2509458 RepID=A0A4P6EBH0_9MICO|nr:hypothetical protein [Microbacterium protaetiae]QAY59532.1 hypothetical protein ET475_05730 [Microbacterium protaetiae]